MKKGTLLILFLSITFSTWRCAHQVAPSGGPKDTIPPKILQETPPNGSTEFKGNSFSIRFNEFIALEQINKQLLISPPMLNSPTFHLKGKTLVVKLNEPLKPNTTYSIYFGSAIVDITEKNPLKNYSYIFSTGSTIDSMSLSGTMINAFDLKPVENAFVLLYKDNNDTLSIEELPLFIKPYYISKTDKSGKFSFRALSDTSYLIFGLNDKNNSLTFDQPTEAIAFIDSLVHPVYMAPAVTQDTTEATTDTLSTAPDSIVQHQTDTLKTKPDQKSEQAFNALTLHLFLNKDTVQRLLEVKVESFNKVYFVFALPAHNISIQTIDSLHFATEPSRYNDTIWWFLKEPHPDTINLLFLTGTDTLDKRQLSLIPKQSRLKRKNMETESPKAPLKFEVVPHNIIKPGEMPIIVFEQPIRKFNTDSVMLITGNDTTYQPNHRFTDSLHRKILFPVAVKPGTNYKLTIPDSAIFDWNGYANSAIKISLRSKESKEYGTLTLTTKVPKKGNYIVQLLDNSDKIKLQHQIFNDTVLQFHFIEPNKYKIKVIFDANGNGKWDTGNYFRKQQPERVLFFPKELDIKANWEYEELWEIK